MTGRTPPNPDRVAGVLLGAAAGDALGAGYEFTTPPPGAEIRMKGGGGFSWEPGEWTDDTQMTICIAEAAAPGYLDPAEVARRFLNWYHGHPKDVGGQITSVLGRAQRPEDLARAAPNFQRTRPDAGGNGSLMRTGPVALAHLGQSDRIAEAAREISSLTHPHRLVGDACVLWCLAIDRAVRDAVIDLKSGLEWIPQDRRDFWVEHIREAEVNPPSGFKPENALSGNDNQQLAPPPPALTHTRRDPLSPGGLSREAFTKGSHLGLCGHVGALVPG